jgi:hypothetical protein
MNLSEAEAKTHRNPSLAQVIAGNYSKGKYKIHGLTVSIENPRGSMRTAKDGSWRVRMPCAYGYILGTEGADSDHVDAFLGPHQKSPLVYVIDQHDHRTGMYDEAKVFLGFASPQQVRRTYHAAFSDGKGKDRIGALHEMTVAQFRDWLKNGDTKVPFRRATGGAVRMADGGAPQFDDSAPVKPLDQPTFADDSKVKPITTTPDEGMMHAVGHGALAGATFNFGDELAGVRAAGNQWVPDFVGPVPARTMHGAYRLAKNWLVGGDPDALAAYERARDTERAAQSSAQEHHPWAYGAGEVAGSIPAMAALPEAGAAARLAPNAGRLARMGADIIDNAVTGATYGGLSGAGGGTTAGERAQGAGAGMIGGAGAGVVAPVAGGALAHAYDRFGRPMVQTVRGWWNPEAEAARRVSAALQRDQELITAGQAQGLSVQDWIRARNAGEPVTLADLGAGHTQSLLRSAANTSPEGRALLEQVINDRFLNQSERVAADVRRLVAGGANAGKTADQLVAEYDVGRAPLYRRAFSQPAAQQMWTPELEQIVQAPSVQNAIRMANVTAKNEAAKLGFTPMRESPFVFDASGRMTLRTRPDGSTVTPNLQYWDAVKKNLDKMGPEGAAWARTLRDHLDSIVPHYADARGFAAKFFGERDALEAGRSMAGKRVDPEVIRAAMRKMDPNEQELFREGYASDWANRVIGNMRDTQDVTKAMFNSPNERARAQAIFGDAGMRHIQARMTLETIMDGARRAMGNSTTARQIIEAGLAGGALGGYASGWDPRTMGESALGFAGARSAPFLGEKLGAHMVSQIAQSARYTIGRVDARTAANVARLLTSDNPQELRQGIRLAASNQRIGDGLKRIANTLALSGTAAPASHQAIRAVPALQNLAHADTGDNGNGPYRGPNLGPIQP